MTNAYIGTKKGVELKYTKGEGKAVSTFSIAVKKDFKEKEYNYFTCILWGKMAEWLAENQGKIAKVGVEGRLETRSYDANDGTKKYVTEIICSHVEVQEWKKDDKVDIGSHNQEGTGGYDFGGTDGVTPIDDGDIPF